MEWIWVVAGISVYLLVGVVMVQFMLEQRLNRIAEVCARKCIESVLRTTQDDSETHIRSFRRKWTQEDRENQSLHDIETFDSFYEHLLEVYGRKGVYVLYFLVSFLWFPAFIAVIFTRERR